MGMRLLIAGTVLLLVVLFLSFFGRTLRPPVAIAAELTPSSFVYMPVVLRKFPLQTVFGVEMSEITIVAGLNEMVDAGTHWVRRNGVLWSDVEPTEGERNWDALAELEQELQNASSQGIQVILVVRSTPEWAQLVDGSSCGPIKVEKTSAFVNFLSDLVTRYSVAPYNVKYWEIWNEPDAPLVQDDPPYGCWGDPFDEFFGGGYYGEVLKALYPEIKTVDPDAQVLIGGLLLDCDPDVLAESTCKSSKFLEGILDAGGGFYFDGVSFHAYDYYFGSLGQYGNDNWESDWTSPGPVAIAKAQFIQDVLSDYGVMDKVIMNTESAIVCGEAGDESGSPGCESDPDSDYEQTKASYIVQVYAAALSKHLLANVWFSVFGWRNSGLLNDDLSPRPAYMAYQFSRQELRDANFLDEISSGDLGGEIGVKGYKFDRGDRKVWVLWSMDGGIHTVTFVSTPLAAWDMLGTGITPASIMEVDLEPLYLEWSP